ncbi:MAG: DUF2911 domain-containing protein [Bacteroidota bacterium]
MKFKPYFFVVGMLFFAQVVHAQLSLPPNGGNERSVVRQYMGSVAYVEIDYRSPDVAGREGQIWGTVVPYGLNGFGFGKSSQDNPSPWRAGANENTTIEFSHDMTVQGQPIAAGKYGFHIITQETGPWTLIFTNETNAWGSFYYTPDDEVLRTEANPEESDFREYLTYEFVARKGDTTTVALIWENKKLPFTIAVPQNNEFMLAQVESELTGQLGFQWNNLSQAANWASGAGFHEHAISWADAALSAPFIGQRNFNTLQTKATVLFAQEKTDEAVEVMGEAIKEPAATAFQIHAYGRQLIGIGQQDKAIEVFKYNHERFEGAWPTNYGLARGYSALGEYKVALKHLKVALENVPENDAVNPPVIEANIKKLENKEDIN